mmetsp:Transcript_633/g.2109  ORF Transcript_633/g.2109 Transcript_633/m.2109 type:complete len:231 (+) Transcript_633:5164-5856(+)
MNRGSTGFRAPPGGPIAATYEKSRICFHVSSFPRSYKPPRSMSVFRSAIGCCVPYRSTLGMFKSSKNSTSFLPAGGPKVSFVRFSTTSSTPRCTSIDVVLDEKFIPSNTCFSIASLERYLPIVTVFAVPLSPTNKTGLPFDTKQSSSHVDRTVSTVGHKMDANFAPGSICKGVTLDRHVNHFFFSTSNLYSYKLAFGRVLGARPSPSFEGIPAICLINLSTRSRSLNPAF